jgi:hypothetical protein
MNQRPVAIGLLLCEQVIVEENTRNVTPVNCFTKQFVERFPSEPLSFNVAVFLTDGLGEMDLTLVIETLELGEEIYNRKIPVRFDNPLLEYRFLIRVRNCRFSAPGHYQATLLAQDEFVAHRKFRVLSKDSES